MAKVYRVKLGTEHDDGQYIGREWLADDEAVEVHGWLWVEHKYDEEDEEWVWGRSLVTGAIACWHPEQLEELSDD